MANDFSGNPVVLDTFTSAIDVASEMGFATGTLLKVSSIEWQTPTTADHTLLLTDAVSGGIIMSETCITAKQSIIKYFHGAWLRNIYVAVSGVGSGSVVITLE